MNRKQELRQRRHLRVRKKVTGTTGRPRLAVFRSEHHIYAQVIDDSAGQTMAAASTLDAGLKGKYGGNVEAAKAVGKLVGERAKEKGVERVVFDRGGFAYHGRIAALADGAREAGLEF
jgi:large subunit ribosomal protein L18